MDSDGDYCYGTEPIVFDSNINSNVDSDADSGINCNINSTAESKDTCEASA